MKLTTNEFIVIKNLLDKLEPPLRDMIFYAIKNDNLSYAYCVQYTGDVRKFIDNLSSLLNMAPIDCINILYQFQGQISDGYINWQKDVDNDK